MVSEAREVVTGIGVSAGRVVGPALLMPDPIEEPAYGLRLPPWADHRTEAARIRVASDRVRADLERAAETAAGDAREVLLATASIAVDPTLLADAERWVVDEHLVPERAVWEAANAVAEQFAALGGYVAERAHDLQDVRDRLVAALTGRPAPGVPESPEPFVLVARELAPSTTAGLDPARILAIVTEGAGPTSHTAIVANAKGIPTVVAATGAYTVLRAGDEVLVDGSTGTVLPRPDPEQVAAVRALAAKPRAFDGEGRTVDGHRVQLLANIGTAPEAEQARRAGAEGVGLFRTEFCFLGRDTPPDVEDQVAAYRPVFEAFAGRRVVIRTLDCGADKPLPFLGSGDEENPALGLRGLRAAERWPELLEDQLAAIARASAESGARPWVMAPMVSTVAEAQHFADRCAAHGLDHAGVMIEVPAAALLAGPILGHVEFASIGTNDLAQYTMAADRTLGSLAALCDPWQPAVLQLIATACSAAAERGRPVGVCGEAASIPALAAVLVGLGAGSLSMTPRALPDVATLLAALTLAECRDAARAAVGALSAADARAAVRGRLPVLDSLGL